jgi:hypothetical protein
MNWRHARQNNISATSTIWQTKKMPSQNNDLAILVMKVKFDNELCIKLVAWHTSSGKLYVMTQHWTLDRIHALSKEDLTNLRQNALDRSNTEVAEMCQAELDKRPSRSVGLKGNASDLRTTHTRTAEHNAAEALQEVALGMLSTYNLIPAVAKTLSVGVKKFMPHALLNKGGKAKVGGDQRKGLLIFDRYISFRVQNEVCNLSVIMSPEGGGTVHYQVLGGDPNADGAVPTTQLRPHLEPESISPLVCVGHEFPTFDEAAKFFQARIEKMVGTYPSLRL